MRLQDVVAILPSSSTWIPYTTTNPELANHFDGTSRQNHWNPLQVRFVPQWGAEGHVWEGLVVGVNHRTSIVSVKINTDYAIRQIADHDVVLTTYNSIASNKFYAAIDWHRIVLDECQEIKQPSSNIASMCANLAANHRWMVSGTPLVSKIEDLHGELNFLQVWPFSLQNDGFWEKLIGHPFRAYDESALRLLHALMDVVMMRHSKTQRYVDGRCLVSMPARTVEWRAFELTTDAEVYIHTYLEIFAADALHRFLGNPDTASFHGMVRSANYGHVRSLLALISRMLTSPNTVVLRRLDHLRRMLVNPAMLQLHNQFHAPYVNPFNGAGGGGVDEGEPAEPPVVRQMRVQEIVDELTMAGGGRGGGMNRDTQRTIASTALQQAEEKARKR